MTDPKNHDDERDETASSGEPEDIDVDAADTEASDAADDAVEDDAPDEAPAAEGELDGPAEDDVDLDDEPTDADLDDEPTDADEEDDESDDRRRDKPVPTGKASRSGNPARAAEGEAKTRSTRPVKPQKIGNRWAAPAMLACAAIGLLWIVLYYVFANRDNPIPLMSDLGDWNLVVGMAFIVAAFGFSMKWE
ncbi:cell division protein CrgA [Solicola gregarius]|uniref:Cell division protein CrgA n=1 Tax=Solicola gregarius TaxID=2908642 RepID=A0AA46YPA1_9ACTN|nr:cell division protein CrgA [Solicola gregarius]UYM07408.1 cell division protein CrgA [Solicola gregarius]